jgi:hypothetical protein
LEPGHFGPIGIVVFDGASPNLKGILASVFNEAKLWGLLGAKAITLLLTVRILGVKKGAKHSLALFSGRPINHD